MNIQIPGYRIINLIDRNNDSDYFEGCSTIQKNRVILRVLKGENKSKIDGKIGSSENKSNYFLNSINMIRQNGEIIVVYKYFPFQSSLTTLIKSHSISIEQFLSISINLSILLMNIHQQNGIIGNLDPNRLLIELESEKVYLIENPFSSTNEENQQDLRISNALYTSPELTGRMGREADIRSDLYSLGIIFYEMLTSQNPFQKGDLLEIFYAHFTKVPDSPTKVNPKIPAQLSLITQKLIEKLPEKRYQSLFGLMKDLEQCKEQFINKGGITTFPLGSKDRISTNKRIFGRDQELKVLHSTFQEVRLNKKEFILISGKSGSGKTALVNEFKQSIADEQIIFAEGKWEQFDRNTPYAPIIRASQTILRQIVANGSKTIQTWKDLFLTKIGHRCQIILELVPEFAWIIGDQNFDEEIGPLELQNSILITFQQFLSVITDEVPIVLFIDDIQWADQPTIDLLRYIAMDNKPSNIFVVLACRDEEEQNTKSIANLNIIKELNIRKLHIRPLKEAEIEEWINCNYHFEQELVPLTTYIYNLSQGNPLFIQQILMTLEKEKFIMLNRESKTFEYFIGKFPESIMGKDIITHFSNKLSTLHERVRINLEFASCFGTVFSLTELSLATQISKDEILKDMYILIEKGFVYFRQSQMNDPEIKLEFIHDKVQQAVYTSIDRDKKSFLHYQIALSKWRLLQDKGGQGYLFDTVDHFNLCMSLLNNEEKQSLVPLYGDAGELAKNTAAFEAAYHYFSVGKELLLENCWQTDYSLTFKIYCGLGECAYLNSDFNVAEHAFEELLQNSKTNEEKMLVYNLKLTLYTHLNRIKDAVDSGTRGLSLFGWKLDRPIRTFTIMKELLLIQFLIRGKKMEDFLNLPPMKSRRNQLIMESLISMNAPTYHVNQNLATYLMLRAFRFTLKEGDTDITALVFNNYALIMSAGFGNVEKSYQFGKLALEHVEKNNVTKLKARVYFVFGSFVNHWKNPVATNLEYFNKAQKLSLESGNFHLAGAGSSFIILTKLMMGESLEEVLAETEEQLALVNKIEFQLSIDFMVEIKDWIQWLRKERVSPPSDLVDYKDDPSAFIMHNTIRLQMYYMGSEDEKAKEIIDVLNRTVTKTLVIYIAPEFYFYHTLWLCRLYKKETKKEQRIYRRLLKRNLKVMGKWAKHAPMNFNHKLLLMKIETERLVTPSRVNERFYEQALELALINGFKQDAAIISEHAANYYRTNGFRRLGQHYVKEALNLYDNWGARRKLDILILNQPDILEVEREKTPAVNGLDSFDLEALLKASRTLSREIVLDILIEKVMEIVIENAGATKGSLFLIEGGDLYSADTSEERMEPVTDSENRTNYPVQLLLYIQKSLESVILHQASEEGMFKKDPYLTKNKVRSVMGIPLLQQGKLIGILYLENDLLSHAFTEKDLLLMSTLASQVAISIQNAKLYMSLEEKVRNRTSELEDANRNLEKVNLELAKAEKNRMDLLSDISHDLRNPITSIQGYIEAMLDGIVLSPEKQMTFLQRSKEKLYGLNRLIQDLFELSKLQYGNMSFLKEIVAVEKLFIHLCDQCEWDIKKQGLSFNRDIVQLNGEFPLVEVDVGRMEQVFTNIVSNAIKHTVEGEISIRLHVNKSSVTFEIKDTGVGIEPEDTERIFERSFTGNRSGSLGGNGLGLSISKEIILHHSGKIWAESETGKGTTIFITIPSVIIEDALMDELEETGVN